jgi:hypothetical protein
MTADVHQSSVPGTKALLEDLNKTSGGPYGEYFLEPQQIAQTIAFVASVISAAASACVASRIFVSGWATHLHSWE